MFEAVDTLARQLVWPGAGLASWLVGAVKIHQQMELRRVAQDGLIEIDDLLRFVIEEVDLHAGDAEIVQPLKERASNFAILNIAAVDPQQQADLAGVRIGDQVAQLIVGPPAPEPLDDLVLETKLPGQIREGLDAF